ncbi:hypothetical protein [Myroides odoratimimus]|uniref:hypothetical protein n=1 Tax=Myroides odoratimimus TaxID=76832 RepID=UPI002575051D|nr:hypothetical protein [Myroides odoratimimus]
MENSFTNQLLSLTNHFLYDDDRNKAEVFNKIFSLIEQNCTPEKLILINNIKKSYNYEKGSFCTINDHQYAKALIPMFSAVFSVLSLPE